MAVLTSRGTDQRLASPAWLLLRRRATVYLPAPARDAVNAAVIPGVELLETDLVERGWLLDPALRDALVRLDTAELVNAGAALLADCDALLGADRPHVPLFVRSGWTSTVEVDVEPTMTGIDHEGRARCCLLALPTLTSVPGGPWCAARVCRASHR